MEIIGNPWLDVAISHAGRLQKGLSRWCLHRSSACGSGTSCVTRAATRTRSRCGGTRSPCGSGLPSTFPTCFRVAFRCFSVAFRWDLHVADAFGEVFVRPLAAAAAAAAPAVD